MASAFARLLRAGGSAVDVGATAAKSFDPGAIGKLNSSSLGTLLKNTDPSIIARGIKTLPSDQLKRVVGGMETTKLLEVMRYADDIELRRITDNMGPGTLSGLLKKADTGQIKKITNNTDPKKLVNPLILMNDVDLKRVTDAMDPKKLGDSLKLMDDVNFKRITDVMDPRTLKKVTDIDPKFFGTQVNLKKVSEQAKQAAKSQNEALLTQAKKVPVNPKAAEAAVDSADTVGDVAKQTDLPRKQVEDAANANAEVVKNSKAGMEAVEKMGFLKKMGKDTAKFTKNNWLKIGAGVTLLCMMYNTSNPFKALERGLKDTGKTVRGLAQAASDFATGLGGLLSLFAQLPAFLMSNAWICAVICLCMILLSVLSSMKK